MFCASRQNASTVWTKRSMKGPTQTFKGSDKPARGHFPEVDTMICACGQEASAVWTERCVLDSILMGKGGAKLVRGIPKLGGFVPACCQDSGTVGTEHGL